MRQDSNDTDRQANQYSNTEEGERPTDKQYVVCNYSIDRRYLDRPIDNILGSRGSVCACARVCVCVETDQQYGGVEDRSVDREGGGGRPTDRDGQSIRRRGR